MTEKLSKTEAIGKIIELAKDIDVKDSIDYSFLNPVLFEFHDETITCYF